MTQKNWQQRNEAYNRERQVMDDWAKKDVELDKVLTEMYKEGAKRIQSRIDGFYMRYAQKEGLTLAEAKKAADMFDVKLWEQDAAKAVADKDFSPYANQWLRLYNLKMKVARDELLKRELELEIAKLTNQVETQMNVARMDAVMKEFERQANILGGSTGTPQRLKSVLNANFYGKSFSERVWGNGGLYHQMQKQVFKSISNIMIDMDGYRKERNRLANVMGVKKHEAMRLLKTEMARIRSDVDLAKYKENGFTHYVFVCEPNPCKICAEYDNQVFEVSKGMTAITMPPLHPNCRCSTYGRVELPDKKISPIERMEFDAWNSSYPHMENITSEYADGQIHDPQIKISNSVTVNGVAYVVGGRDVVLDHSNSEFQVANWLSAKTGREVVVLPRVNKPDNIKTPDYLLDGIPFDLKEITGVGKNVIDGNVKKAKKQGANIVFDITNTPLSEEEVLRQLHHIYKIGRRGLEVSIVKRKQELLFALKPRE